MGTANFALAGKQVWPQAPLGPIGKGLVLLLFSAALWQSTTLLMSSCTHHSSATAAAAGADAEGPPPPSQLSIYLFGGDRPWNTTQFTASDDRVRGGKSQSYLTELDTEDPGVTPPVKFHGTLDITALGGAGFASQRTVDDFPSLDLSHYESIVLGVRHSDGNKYTVTIKDEVLPKRPDGREQSTISWEYDFTPRASMSSTVYIPFNAFKPTYRGRPKPDADPLDLKNVKRISFMMRSFFGEQEGDFSITLDHVRAENMERHLTQGGPEGPPSSNVADNGLLSWLARLVAWRS
ncbi:complex I intermediate-associated protein 30-domain-containing protein [Coniella lustricola]|uniref:Complex I intermediate-associated protein 30-domain-containing protein n=1 Tax=Coniella lustricola TaxID=2025994 RepID=A0A2T2ZTQ8_9PEZI|nr:complex I intermediate-associated protein 30-domain-containing protein [Coniella lustricola]